MKLSDYLASFLVKERINHVFLITGGAAVHLVHSLAQQKKIKYICVQHEQVAAMAADAYSRMTKNLGCAMATSGPGMTNLITGIACAYFDSTPALYITGQVNTFESKQGRSVRQIGFQETDIVSMVKPITKFSARIDNAKDVRYYLEKAVYLAKHGRGGPVLLDIPMDIQRAEINPSSLKRFDPQEIPSETDSTEELKQKIYQVLKLIPISQRPIVIAGGGIRYADMVTDFIRLIEILRMPVVATWSGIDVIFHNHPLYIGQIGVYGSRAANFAVQNSDLIISFGSRLDTRITGGKPNTFAREAKKVVIDIDKNELYKRRGLDPDIGICQNIKKVLPAFISILTGKKMPKFDKWLEITKKWKEKYPAVLPQWEKRKDKVNPYVFIKQLSQMLNSQAVVIADCGANLTWTIQAFQIKKGQRLFSAMGNSPMGYAVSAGIGASVALGKKKVYSIIGDGGFQLNIQDLQTIVYYKLPVKIFILNNHSYGIIKQFQDMYFDGVYEASCPKSGYSVPDFIKIAKAYGLKTVTIRNHRQLKSKISQVIRSKKAIVCDVIIPDDASIIPKLEFGKPIEDLSPPLSRKEFKQNMIVSVLS